MACKGRFHLFVLACVVSSLAVAQSTREISASAATSFNQILRDQESLERNLKSINAKQRSLQQERAYIGSKLKAAQKNLERASLAKPDADGTNAGILKWQREIDAWQARFDDAESELRKVDLEQKSLLSALEAVASSGKDEVLIPGDILQIYVAEDESFNGLYQVRRGGYVIMPRIARVFVMGKSLSEAEAEIRKKLMENQLRVATVNVEKISEPMQVTEQTDGILYFSGLVDAKGIWPIPAGYKPTLVTALLRVGYDEQFADLEAVRVLRLVDGRGLVETVNVKSIMDGDGLASDYSLQSGDIIIVSPKGPSRDEDRMVDRMVNVTGEVNEPGLSPIEISNTKVMTAYMALLLCGGPTDNADLTNVMLVRIADRETRWIKIDIKAIMEGRLPDIPLKNQDFLVVPAQKGEKRVYLTGRVRVTTTPVTGKGAAGGLASGRRMWVIVPPEDYDMTVYQLILQNGEFEPFANLKKVYVLRDMGHGVRNRIPLNLKDVMKGIIPDLIVENNDIVVVPERFLSF